MIMNFFDCENEFDREKKFQKEQMRMEEHVYFSIKMRTMGYLELKTVPLKKPKKIFFLSSELSRLLTAV